MATLNASIFKNKKVMIHLGLLFLVSAFVRLWGISHDLPRVDHMDVGKFVVEPSIMFQRAGHMSAHGWDKPTAHMHIYAVGFSVYKTARNLCMRTLTLASNTFAEQAAGELVERPELSMFEAHFVSRVISALMGAAVPILLFLTASLAGGRRMGFIAGWLGCFCPHLAEYGHTENAYTPMTFFCLLSFYFSLRYLLNEKTGRSALVFAGVFSGYAVQTQFNAFPILIPAGMALFRGQEKIFSKTAFMTALKLLHWIIAGFIIGMIISDPFFILDVPGFIQGVLDKFFRYSSPIERFWTFEDPIPLVIAKQICQGLSPLVCILAGAGAVIAVIKNKRFIAMTIVFPLLSYAVLSQMNVAFPRYYLAMLPFLLLMAAYGLDFAFAKLPDTKWSVRAGYLVLAVVLWSPITQTVKNGVFFSLKDTRTSAGEWIENNAPAGTNIIAEKYEPPIEKNRFRFSMVYSLSDHELEKYRQLGVRYLITSDYLSRRYTKKHSPANVARYEEIEKQLRTVAHFKLKHLLLFYHPEIKIYEILGKDSRRNPAKLRLPNVPTTQSKQLDVLYPENLIYGKNPHCIFTGNQRTVTRYIKTQQPLEKVAFMIHAGKERNRVHIKLNGHRTKTKVGAFESRFVIMDAGKSAMGKDNLYKLTVRADSDPKAMVRILTDSFDIALAALEQGKTDTAVTLLEQLSKDKPSDLMVKLYLASAYSQAGNSTSAAEALKATGFFKDSNLLGWIFDSTESDYWHQRFAKVFGLKLSDLSNLRTLYINASAKHCPENKRIWFDPEENAVCAIPNDDYKDKASRFMSLRQLRLDRGWYDIEIKASSQTAAGQTLLPGTDLIKITASLCADNTTLGRTYKKYQAGAKNNQFTKTKLRIYSTGYAAPLDIKMQTMNNCDVLIRRIIIRPLPALSLAEEVLDALEPFIKTARQTGDEILANQTDNFVRIHRSLMDRKI